MRTNFCNLPKPALILAVVMCCLLFSACDQIKREEKPFIIFYKSYYEGKKGVTAYYGFYDKNGKYDYFWDDDNKYNIGDTIK